MTKWQVTKLDGIVRIAAVVVVDVDDIAIAVIVVSRAVVGGVTTHAICGLNSASVAGVAAAVSVVIVIVVVTAVFPSLLSVLTLLPSLPVPSQPLSALELFVFLSASPLLPEL